MDYCSIDDAFPAMGPPSTAVAVKQHRRKKPKQGMTTEPPEPVSLDTDPDRSQYTKKEIPEPESYKESFSDTTTNFFGKSIDDDFAPYTGPIAKDDFLLQPDFKNIFGEKGFGKASGLILKPENTHFKEIDTVFQQTSIAPSRRYETDIKEVKEDNEIKKQLDRLRARLDDLEKSKEITQANTQAEITLFVMSGLAFIFIMDLVGKV